jgi:putative transposase
LVAILDWATRKVLSHRLSISMTSDFCVEALEEAMPSTAQRIFNTDQGSQFTSEQFTQVLKVNYIQISMDGKVDGWTTCSSSVCGGA